MFERDGCRVSPIIGLEIHVQLATRTKMFCGCGLEFGATPNSRVCPVCLGMPGALPVINARAVEYAVRAGLALQCEIAGFTKWDRKSYYYPDLPKNYQISQYDLPLCGPGHFSFLLDGREINVRIRRAHLEEDAGKNVHDWPGITAVDLNRAGTPLLEIVSEPDLHSAEETREFAVQLQRLVSYLGVSEANMQKGQMRFEPNINLKIEREGQEFRTPIVEVKNLNSFKALHGAIAFEIERQFEEWKRIGTTASMGNKTNRGWDDVQEVTVAQREKEEAHDYRYFPDPDLVPLTIATQWVNDLRAALPELPIARTKRFIAEFKLAAKDAPALVDDRATADLLDAAAGGGADKATLGKHFLSYWSRYANERGVTIGALGVPAATMAELATLVTSGKVNATAAAQIADAVMERGGANREWPSPAKLAEELGLVQSRDEGQIGKWVEEAFAANEKAVKDAIENPKKIQAARGFLLGQVMKISGGKADPKIVGGLIEDKLKALAGGG